VAKRLLVLRHGKSDHGLQFGSDFERPLAPRGIQAAGRIAELLKEKDLVPELIVSSPANRAISTAEIIHKKLPDSGLVSAERIYAADVDDLLWVVNSLPDEVATAMLVGHNPGFEELVDDLCGRSDSIMKTCSLAVIDCPFAMWAQVISRKCSLVDIYHPRELDD
jgi:phosphohistidine phosphatase